VARVNALLSQKVKKWKSMATFKINIVKNNKRASSLGTANEPSREVLIAWQNINNFGLALILFCEYSECRLQ